MQTEAADDLYGGAPDDFMETRKRLVAAAKKAGDADLAKKIGALAVHPVSAWALNGLTHGVRPDELERLLDLGAELRSAWASGEPMGGIDQRRGELISQLARMTRSLARRTVVPCAIPRSGR